MASHLMLAVFVVTSLVTALYADAGASSFAVSTEKDIPNPKPGKTLILPNVVNKEGQGYDIRSGVFTAPTSGIYVFDLTVMLECRGPVTTVKKQLKKKKPRKQTRMEYIKALRAKKRAQRAKFMKAHPVYKGLLAKQKVLRSRYAKASRAYHAARRAAARNRSRANRQHQSAMKKKYLKARNEYRKFYRAEKRRLRKGGNAWHQISRGRRVRGRRSVSPDQTSTVRRAKRRRSMKKYMLRSRYIGALRAYRAARRAAQKKRLRGGPRMLYKLKKDYLKARHAYRKFLQKARSRRPSRRRRPVNRRRPVGPKKTSQGCWLEAAILVDGKVFEKLMAKNKQGSDQSSINPVIKLQKGQKVKTVIKSVGKGRQLSLIKGSRFTMFSGSFLRNIGKP